MASLRSKAFRSVSVGRPGSVRYRAGKSGHLNWSCWRVVRVRKGEVGGSPAVMVGCSGMVHDVSMGLPSSSMSTNEFGLAARLLLSLFHGHVSV